MATKQQKDFILMNVNSADIVNVARTDDVITAAVFVLKYLVGGKKTAEVKREFYLNVISITTLMLKFDVDTHMLVIFYQVLEISSYCILNM